MWLFAAMGDEWVQFKSIRLSDSHEEHQLDDRRSPKEFTEGVDEEVIGQQAQLDQQHQGIAAGLKHGPVTPHRIALC